MIKPNGVICELNCNIDDMSSESLAYAQNILLKNGALDVFFTPIYMKKNRPAHLLNCICKVEDADKMAELILKHTTSWGVRKKEYERYTMDRRFTLVPTKYGEITVKFGSIAGVEKFKVEHEEAAKAAEEFGVGINEVINEVSAVYQESKKKNS